MNKNVANVDSVAGTITSCKHAWGGMDGEFAERPAGQDVRKVRFEVTALHGALSSFSSSLLYSRELRRLWTTLLSVAAATE